MLVRYRTTSAATLANFQADIDGIIQGTITQVSQLSSPAQANSSFYGSYPTGIYSRVNGTSYTYSKAHNTVAGYTHYFRLTYDSTQMTTITLAQSYTSGTDTLVNSSAKTVNIQRFAYDSNYPVGLDIIINNKFIFFQAVQSGAQLGIFDIGHTGVTRSYTNSMLMSFQDFAGVLNNNQGSTVTQPQVFYTLTGGTIPYGYNFDSLSYGTITTGYLAASPYKKFTATNTLGTPENPVYVFSTANSNLTNLLYGVYKLPTGQFSGIQLYKDASNLYRLTLLDFAFLVD